MKRNTLIKALINALALGLIAVIALVATNTIRDENDELIKQLEEDRDMFYNDVISVNSEKSKIEEELSEARNNLALASEAIEDLSTKLVYTTDENTQLKEENEYLLERSEYVFNGRWNYDYTREDVKIMAAVIYAENYINGGWEMMLTGSVVENRILSSKFPNSLREVIYQKSDAYEQYAPRTKRIVEAVLAGTMSLPEECYGLAEILLRYGPVAPEDVLYQAHFNQGEVFWEWEGEEFCFG